MRSATACSGLLTMWIDVVMILAMKDALPSLASVPPTFLDSQHWRVTLKRWTGKCLRQGQVSPVFSRELAVRSSSQ